MKRRRMELCVIVVVMSLCGLKISQAQEASKPESEDNKAKAERPEKPAHAYRVDLSINEIEGGKKINTRHYAMDLTSGTWNEVRISSRVPVPTSQNPNQTLDVGTSINCRLNESGEDAALQVDADFSNFLSSDEQHADRPVIRQIRISGSTFPTSGKPVEVGSVDDPNSNHQFELEVIVTRLK